MRSRMAVMFAALGLTVSSAALAQSVRGVIADGTARPIAGAVVSLLDSLGVSSARALTSDSGTYRLLAPRAGTYRLRTARIGFVPTISEPFVLHAGETRVQPSSLAFVALSLSTIRVTDRSACRQRNADSAAQAFALWEQARTALTAAQLTVAARAITATTATFERSLELRTHRITSQTAELRTDVVTQPWRSVSPDTLRRVGYLSVDDDNLATYYSPDLDVLLSPAFLDDHCVRVVPPTDARAAGRIGLSFEPVAARRMTPEIAGTLWLDSASAPLRDLEFHYVNVPAVRAQEAGGTSQFVALPTGAWVITRWEIRMPVTYQPRPKAPWRVADLRSRGGQLVSVMRGAELLWQQPSMSVSGTVLDSLTTQPLANARIVLVGTTASATTDARGQFVLRNVLGGEYRADIHTPSLDSLGATHRVDVTVVEGAAPLRVLVPSAAQVASTLCGASSARDTRFSAIVGTVRVGTDSAASAGTRVLAEWREQTLLDGRVSQRTRRLETRTGDGGAWRFCSVPTGELITLRAQPAAGRADAVTVQLTREDRLRAVMLSVDVLAAPVATFTGVVVSADSTVGPLLDAEVLLPELQRSIRTNARGEFRFDDVPVGPQRVQVRRLGFGALDTQLTFVANEEHSRRIVLSRITVLDSVETRAEYRIPSFEENRRVGLGHFLTRDDLAKMENRTFSAVLSNFNGTKFIPGKVGNRVYLASSRGPQSMSGLDLGSDISGPIDAPKPACYAHVYLDNMPIYVGKKQPLFDLNSISPDRIESIEYYRSPAQTPARYSNLNATCGVLVIWSRRTYDEKK